MKKYYYNSPLARLLLMFSRCDAITLGAFAFCRRAEGEMPGQTCRNHECTHMRQWAEVTAAAALLLWLSVLACGLSAWWLMAAPLAYYVWYGAEYLARLARLHDAAAAYRAIAFEQEAYAHQGDDTYNTNAPYFAWTGYLGRKGGTL